MGWRGKGALGRRLGRAWRTVATSKGCFRVPLSIRDWCRVLKSIIGTLLCTPRPGWNWN